jgi:CubicO group peptidase (beta-lactamase class C family)
MEVDNIKMSNKEKAIDALFEQEIKKDSPGAALAVIKDGSIIYKNGYGIACMDYDIPITPSTIFHVASVSKQFTAFAIVLLADQDKLSLNDDIRKYLPEISDFGKTITIRHLIHHTSGLRDQWELLIMAGWRIDDVITNEHILKIVRHQKELNFDPGEEYLYCNTGYTLMGEIVARVSGQSFREFTAKNIFEPLGMNNTHFHDDHRMIVKNMAYSYDPDGNDGFKKSVLSFANVGATSLFTTVEDLAKWLDNFDKKTVGGETVINQMLQKGKLNNGIEIDYAFAVVIGKYRELATFGHGGMDAGYRSHIIFFPDQKFGVIVLSNLGSFSPYNLAMRVADIYLADQLAPMEIKEEEATTQQPEKTYSVVLDEYVGSYYSDELGTEYVMVIKDDKLVRKHRRLDDVVLTCIARDIFNGHGISSLAFTRDKSNNIIGFKLTGWGRVRNLRFDKRSI